MAKNRDGIDNLLTKAVQGASEAIGQAQERLETAIGTTPFMKRELTKYQKRQRYENLAPQDFQGMIQQHGPDAVLDMIKRHEKQRRNR